VTDDVWAEFRAAVNMTAAELRKWLDSDESKHVGQKQTADAESVGHYSGRKIVAILGKNKAEISDADEAHMHKVVGYIHRHRAQRPHGDVSATPWRYSLMNWGHDPLKK
jgi:DNA topoisomerase VI subunit B